MARHTVKVLAGGAVDVQSVKAKKPNPASKTEGDEVRWLPGGPDATSYRIVFGSDNPFSGNNFPVPSGFQPVRQDAAPGKHAYNVTTSTGGVLMDPDVDVE
jgi:hypothetical protein